MRWQRPQLSRLEMNAQFLLPDWKSRAEGSLSRDTHGRRLESLLRGQLHNVLSTQEHMRIPTRLKQGHIRALSKRSQTEDPQTRLVSLRGPWVFHGSVNFPLTLTGPPLNLNKALIESGQCPLAARRAGSQCSLQC